MNKNHRKLKANLQIKIQIVGRCTYLYDHFIVYVLSKILSSTRQVGICMYICIYVGSICRQVCVCRYITRSLPTYDCVHKTNLAQKWHLYLITLSLTNDILNVTDRQFGDFWSSDSHPNDIYLADNLSFNNQPTK